MFFHPVRNIKDVKIKKSSVKDKKSYHDKVGLKPIVCLSPVADFMINSFGHIRNDIQQFMTTKDVQLKESIVQNLNQVIDSGSHPDASIQDLFDSIIPSCVQTPAEISSFCRVLETRYKGMIDRNTKLSDLREIVDPPQEAIEKPSDETAE